MTLGFLLLGCESHPTDQMTQAVVSGERPVAMAGSEPFFGGEVVAKVTVSRGIGRGSKRGSASLPKGEAHAYDDYAKADSVNINPLTPVTLHLILTNTGALPVTVRMTDFNSELGNFVVDPESLTLAAGQKGEPTPMISQLGVSSDQIPVTVTLKVGNTRETHVVVVKNLLDENGKLAP